MTQPHTPNRRRLLVLTILALTFIVAAVVVWRVENAPTTDDAYAYADTIDVVPEVNGRIAEMPIRDNQEVRQGDLLFRIDPRPYQDALAASDDRMDQAQALAGLVAKGRIRESIGGKGGVTKRYFALE